MSSRRKGFTLIELLVVISIIGLLSSVVLASLSNARQKGIVAAGLTFSERVYHKLGNNIIAAYDFNDSGSIAQDSSGNAYNLTLSNGAAFDTTNTVSGNGSSLKLGGANTASRAAYAATKSQVFSNYAASIWTNGNASNKSTNLFVVFNTTYPLLTGLFCDSNGYLYAYALAQSGGNTAIAVSDAASPVCIDLNRWHQVTLSYSSSASTLSLYVDGSLSKQVPSQVLVGGSSGIGYSIYVGQYSSGSYGGNSFNGNVDDFRLYSDTITAQEASKLYAEGLERHQDLAQK